MIAIDTKSWFYFFFHNPGNSLFMGLANCATLGEHRAFNAFGFTLYASALISNDLGAILVIGFAKSKILSEAIKNTNN